MSGDREDAVGYFAYGSDLDPERFRERVGGWRRRRPAVLHGFRLRFSAEAPLEGGAGAVIVPARRGRVHGAVYDLSAAQLAALDARESAPCRDVRFAATRRSVVVDVDGRLESAEAHLVPRAPVCRAPSEVHLGHILRGLEDVGWGPEVIEAVRRAAASERR